MPVTPSFDRVRLLVLLVVSVALGATIVACSGRRLDGRYTQALWGSAYYDVYDDRVEYFLYDRYKWTGTYGIEGDQITICSDRPQDCTAFTTENDFQCFEHIGLGEYCRFADRQP